MIQELNFTIYYNIEKGMSSPWKLSYYPDNNGDSRLIKCSKMIYENHGINLENINSITEFTTETNMKLKGILCYTDRMNYGIDYGLVLCNNYEYENMDKSLRVAIENDHQPSNHLLELDMIAETSYIVTLQLWINYKGNGRWEGNEVYLINVEESTKKFEIPSADPENGDEECYGLKVIQDRIVYEIEDGMNLKRFFVNEFWFIVVSYFVSLWILRVINTIFERKKTSKSNNLNSNDVNKLKKGTTDAGERGSTLLRDPRQDG